MVSHITFDCDCNCLLKPFCHNVCSSQAKKIRTSDHGVGRGGQAGWVLALGSISHDYQKTMIFARSTLDDLARPAIHNNNTIIII